MNRLVKIRIWLLVFIVGLVASGLTVFPLGLEVELLHTYLGEGSRVGALLPDVARMIDRVQVGVLDTLDKYPFLFYGTDWLGFAHILLGILFIGPLKDPVKNIWVIEFGIIACILVVPFAFICGPMRGIPLFWTLVDCSFGVVGIIPLLLVRKHIQKLETL
jgi:hypothetical protein